MSDKKITISRGNKKVKANIFNLPAIKTCKDNLECHKYCYALKAERLYKNAKASRQSNLDASMQSDFVDQVVKLLKTRRNKVVRIHESGDFYSVSYIYKWYEIMKLLPDFKFYAYTKRDDHFNIKVLRDKPDNFTLTWSVDGIYDSDTEIYIPGGYDNVAVIVETLQINNCPAINNKDLKCVIDCKKCLYKDQVIKFKKH